MIQGNQLDLKRSWHATILYKDFIIAIGREQNGENVVVLNTKQNQLVPIEMPQDLIPPGLQGHSACLIDENTIIVYGGHYRNFNKPSLLCLKIVCDNRKHSE